MIDPAEAGMIIAAAEGGEAGSGVLAASFLAALGFALVHLLSGRLGFAFRAQRSPWLSIAGGVSVAYVFVHLLPELEEHQEVIAEALGETLAFLEHQVYLLALLGLAVYYAVARIAEESREDEREAGRRDKTTIPVFWLDMGAFSLYNAIIGYLLLHRVGPVGLRTVLLFFSAMALHFWINDVDLRDRHKGDYTRIGRWVLAAAVVAGWAAGAFLDIPEAMVSALMAFLAGGLVLNTLTEELPEARHSQYWAFALGAAAYAAILLAL